MMDYMSGYQFLPGDPRLIDQIVCELKSQGIFDQFRKECLADVDTKPAYQNLRQRVEGSVSGFLNSQKWKPDMNKNQLREKLRKTMQESGFLEVGVERIVDQVVNPKIFTVFLPQVEDVVYKYLGVEKPYKGHSNYTNGQLEVCTDMLINDLEAISPDSVNSTKLTQNINADNNLQEMLRESKSRIVEECLNTDLESPAFEPLIEKNIYCQENSNDSHLSGISGLTSQGSVGSPKVNLDINIENLNHDSHLSHISNGSHLSTNVVSNINLNNIPLPNTFTHTSPQVQTTETFNLVNQHNFLKMDVDSRMSFDSDTKEMVIVTESSNDTIEDRQGLGRLLNNMSINTKDSSSSSPTLNKSKIVSSKSSKNSNDKLKVSNDKLKNKTHTSNKSHTSQKSDSNKVKTHNSTQKDSKHSSSSKYKNSGSKFNSEKSQNHKQHKDHIDNSSKKNAKDYASSDKSSTKKSHHSVSSASKHKRDKYKSDRTSSSSRNKHKSRTSDHSSKNHKNDHIKDNDKDKPRKKSKFQDDHGSAKGKKSGFRRSTDRDSNDGSGSSSKNLSSSYIEPNTDTKKATNSETIENKNSSGLTVSETTKSELMVNSIELGNKVVDSRETITDSTNISEKLNSSKSLYIERENNIHISSPMKIRKPKIASNIFEARKLIKVRRRIERKMQKQKLKQQQLQRSIENDKAESLNANKECIKERNNRQLTFNNIKTCVDKSMFKAIPVVRIIRLTSGEINSHTTPVGFTGFTKNHQVFYDFNIENDNTIHAARPSIRIEEEEQSQLLSTNGQQIKIDSSASNHTPDKNSEDTEPINNIRTKAEIMEIIFGGGISLPNNNYSSNTINGKDGIQVSYCSDYDSTDLESSSIKQVADHADSFTNCTNNNVLKQQKLEVIKMPSMIDSRNVSTEINSPLPNGLNHSQSKSPVNSVHLQNSPKLQALDTKKNQPAKSRNSIYNTQCYSNEDLYKPRPSFGSSRRKRVSGISS